MSLNLNSGVILAAWKAQPVRRRPFDVAQPGGTAMTKYGFIVAGVTGLVASLLSGQASAAPTCTSTITITTITSEADSALGAGVCVAAGDKIFGNFNFSTLDQTGGSVL